MTININGCLFNYQIDPPDYCSGCDKFFEANIKNVRCTTSVVSNTWSFDLMVPGNGAYTIKKLPFGPTVSCSYNSNCTIQAGTIEQNCITYELLDPVVSCYSTFTICPVIFELLFEARNIITFAMSYGEAIFPNGMFSLTLDLKELYSLSLTPTYL